MGESRGEKAILRGVKLALPEKHEMDYFAQRGQSIGTWGGATSGNMSMSGGTPNMVYTVSNVSPSNVYNAAQLRQGGNL